MEKTPGYSFAMGQYALLWRLAQPFAARHKRLKDDFPLRLAPEEWRPPFPADYWIQAASGGESFLVRQLLEELNARAEQTARTPLRVLCTSCTRQGLDVLNAAKTHGDTAWPALKTAVRVFPLDAPAVMRRAVDFASPKTVVLLETELWPGLMAACAERGIPLVTVNGRMTKTSYAGYRWFAPLWRMIAPERILAMADADASRFAALFGAERVSVMPNMKFDGVPPLAPAPESASPAMALLPASLPVVLLASVREEEEPLLEPVLAYLRAHASDAAVVVAPRHMERADAWETLLAKVFGEKNTLRYSSLMPAGGTVAPGQAVLWDVFGQLRDVYARAESVFVGGSLAKLGGQNFLEAAGQGRIPVVGPHWKNFSWVGEEFFAAGLGTRVNGPAELGPALVRRLHDVPDPETVRAKTAAYVAPRRGGTRAAANALLAVLDSRKQR